MKKSLNKEGSQSNREKKEDENVGDIDEDNQM
jgi:hypothetical protein